LEVTWKVTRQSEQMRNPAATFHDIIDDMSWR
jgi:hypothetical protein